MKITLKKASFEKLGSINKGLLYSLAGLVTSIVLMAVVLAYVEQQDQYDAERMGYTSEQRVLSQRIVKYALESASGKEVAFDQLRLQRDRFAETMTLLRDGNPETGLPPSPPESTQDLQMLETRWSEFRDNADIILSAKDAVLEVRQYVQVINDLAPQLLALSDDVVNLLVKKGADLDVINLAGRQRMLSQRIENNVNKVLSTGRDAAIAADRFSQDANLFGQVLEGMLKGDERLGIVPVRDNDVRAKLRDIAMLFSTVSDHAGAILQKSPMLFQVQEAATAMADTSETLHEGSRVLGEKYAQARDDRIGSGLGYFFGFIALIFLVLLVIRLVQEARERQRVAEAQNRRNQEAILRLLDEMGNLADGDLTAYATVTEDITGAIADSVNYTIDALRSLVTTINETAQQVASAAQGAQGTATELARASSHQAEQITAAGAAINEMAASIEQVSRDAIESADVAHKSVDIAHKGAETVRNTIQGMDTIREQIQETAKRIKRLGESSQEIGDIVELINDIADQTNILALNAAIQASMAGEAGRGFAVVADEVQRLAERSGNATKRIEALVKAIQADTNEAVSSMEQSTANVVAGAKLTEAAGKALEEIENVSGKLARLIENISEAAKQQASKAVGVSDTMHVIQGITTRTSEGVNETAASIGNLAELAKELRKSVAGFKLPE